MRLAMGRTKTLEILGFDPRRCHLDTVLALYSAAPVGYRDVMADHRKRKILFVLFSDDTCRQNHAFMYALDLHKNGYDVRVIIEGAATKVMTELALPDSRTGQLLRKAHEAGLVAGACARASSGCASGDPARDVAEIARTHGIALLSDMDGHASIEPFVRDGYEVVAL